MENTRDGLIDQHGRVATDLRVSLTDRWNPRCEYCLPAEGLDWLPSEEPLTDEELIRLIGINDPSFLQPTGPMSAIGG